MHVGAKLIRASCNIQRFWLPESDLRSKLLLSSGKKQAEKNGDADKARLQERTKNMCNKGGYVTKCVSILVSYSIPNRKRRNYTPVKASSDMAPERGRESVRDWLCPRPLLPPVEGA